MTRLDLSGKHLIGDDLSARGSKTFTAVNPSTSEVLAPPFHEGTPEEAGEALALAASAFDALRRKSPEERARFLDAIAEAILALGDPLLERANAETGLPIQRLTMERGRTANQARLFASLIREGSWVDARIDHAIPDRQPLPKPDVRRMLAPIGPVVVFGASNFPLAISVAGTDTVSALGAGCPVIAKAHPAHPGTCEMVGRAILDAARKTGMPRGAFSMLHGAGNEVGLSLVKHPETRAVAFTGSLRGGRALFDAAAARPSPIPVYAEMGSVNPVFVLPGALAQRGEQIAEGFIQSVTLGTGQFCTCPGIVVGLKGADLGRFESAAGARAAAWAPATMLHKGILGSYESGLERLAKTGGVAVVARSTKQAEKAGTQAACVVFSTDAGHFLASKSLAEENFGPSSVVVRCETAEDLERIAESFEGQLSATIHGTPEDLVKHRRLVEILERKTGRLVFNGFPTGLEVCPSIHHGGPYPAATHSHFGSVGTAAILRFVRPICYQGFPQEALPPELKDSNPRGIWRLVDGQIGK